MASIDFSYPNDRAIDQIGILDEFNRGEVDGYSQKHPDGWIQAVIDRVQADIASSNRQYDKVDWSDYTTEERAAWDWYTAEVTDTDSWKELVEDYKKNDVPAEDSIHWDKFDESDHLDIDGRFSPPDVRVHSGGGDNKDGDLKVSTEAIRYFANSIGELFDHPDGKGGSTMLRSADELAELEVLPGLFAVAEVMRRKIHGSGESTGLVGDTQGLLTKIHETLYTLRLSLLDMADSYELTEEGNARTGKDFEKRTKEFNTMTAEEFGNAMADPWGHIKDIGDYGNTSSSGTGGTGGSGDGGGKESGDTEK
ncbi:hypothetical protein ACWCHM_15860 [Micromonospora sp. SCSIO 07396]